MSLFNFGNIKKELNEVSSIEQGITFEGKVLVWNTAEDVKDVVDALNNEKVVNYLKLDGNTLGVDAAAAIGAALGKHPEMRKALWKNMFTSRDKNEIPLALKHLGDGLIKASAQLTVLDLSDNALGPIAMTCLEGFLSSKVCYSLQELHLNNCGLGPEGGRMLSKALLQCIANSENAGTPLKLRVFVTGRNRLTDDGARAIAKVFEKLNTLEEIAMPQNSIYHEGITALSQGFKMNPNLRVLNLNDNTVTEKGAVSLADAFAVTQKLRNIDFGDCLLKTNGAYLFASALELEHDELEVVDLSFNDINADGGIMLITALAKKPNIKILNLDGNMFGATGCRNIIDELKEMGKEHILQGLEGDESECDEEDDDDDDLYVDDEDEEGDEEEYDYDEDEDDYDNFDHVTSNDTTKDADEEYLTEQNENDNDETAYVTTTAYTSTLNESIQSSTKSNPIAIELEYVNPEIFCKMPVPTTIEMFNAIKETNKFEAFIEVLKQHKDKEYLALLVFTTLKCANLSRKSEEANDVAIKLFQYSFDYAVETNQERQIINFYLKQLNLLQNEEKYKTEYDVDACRYALRSVLKTDKVASENIRTTFELFLKNFDKQ